MNKKTIFKRCIKEWGLDANIHQLIEELGELIVAVLHYPRKKATKQDLLTELVDVQMMLDISRDIYNISEQEFDREMNRKLKRVENLLNCNKLTEY